MNQSLISDMRIADGEIHRVPTYSETHPDLIKIPEYHFSLKLSAYSKIEY